MIEVFILIWLLLVLVLTFYRIEWGVSLFLAYLILVPVMRFSFNGLELGENIFNFIFLFGYFSHANKRGYKTQWKPFIPFLTYFFLLLVIMPFQGEVPLNIMLNQWRVDIMRTLILPFVIWNLIANDILYIKIFRNTFLVSISIAVVYGLFLTTTGGFNPYIMSLTGFTNVNDLSGYYAAEGSGRMFGRISSVFVHPMQYALFIGFSFVYIFQLCKKTNIYIIVLLVSLGISAITCGVRSVLGGLAVTIVYYLMKIHNYKVVFVAIIIAVVVNHIIGSIPELSAYMGSMVDFNNESESVGGSSFDMRLYQLNGAINEASKNPIFGLGYGWTGYYHAIHGDHPICLAFESLIFIIICNWGLVGGFIWCVLLFLYFRNYRNMNIDDIVLLDCLIVFYVVYSCITGEYGYMRYFALFYILMLGNSIECKKVSLR